MGERRRSFSRAAKIGVFVASLVLALSMTGTAFAAGIASFSGQYPRQGSSTTVTKPNVTIIVYDRYGVRGLSNYSMTINGQAKKVRISYFAGYGYRKFKLSYQVQSDMSVGLQKVVVNVKDLRSYRSSYAWNFTVLGGTVLDGTPPVTTSDAALSYAGPATIHLSATDNAGGSGVAHTYYKLDGGAQTEGTAITVSAAGSHALEYWSVDVAGNVEAKHSVLFTVALPTFVHWTPALSCTVAGCHWADLATIHIAKGCAMCHANGVTPRSTCTDAACHGTTMPLHHTAGTHPVIASSGTPSCTQATCHGTAAVAIHTGGCAVCHNSPLAVVKAAVANGNATCETCHTPSYAAIHAAGTASHAVSGACFNSQCHPSDAAAIHTAWANPPGCAACHGAGKTPSLTCATCHSNIGTVHDFAHANASGTKSTACTACHGTDLPAVHTNVGCVCHTASFLVAEMTPLILAGNAECVDCHTGAHAAHAFNNTATGHNTTTYGTIGGKTKFDGSQGVTLHTIETSATSPTFGQIGVLETDWQLPLLNVFWGSTDASAPADAKKGLTWSSVVTCQDCHTGLSAAGPHGAAQNWGIDPNYPGDLDYAELSKWIVTNPSGIKVRSTLDPRLPKEPTKASWDTSGYAFFSGVPTTNSAINFDGQNHAIICSKCHDLMNFDVGMMDERAPSLQNWKVPGTGAATDTVTGFINTSGIGGSNTAHGQTHFDSYAGAAQCVNCHIAIPHGWKRPRLIVNSGPGFAFDPFPAVVGGYPTLWKDNTNAQPADPAPYRSPKQFGTSDGLATYGGVSGGPWWGMDAFVAADWGETTKPNPAQANPNPVQPLPPHDRIDDHDALRVGMQTISGTDEHELIASSPGSNAAGTYTGMNNNYIEWVEYKCGACDFHHPYSDPRVSDPVGVGGDTIIVVE